MPHSRKFLVPKRLMNWILHLTVLFVIQKLSITFFKAIYKEDADVNYYLNIFFAPFTLSLILIVNVCYIFIYYTNLPYFRKLKANNVPWPWEEDLERFKKILPEMIVTYMSNMFVLTPLYINIIFRIWKIDISMEGIPSFLRFFITTWMCYIVEDFIFYWAHRLIHLPRFYWVHKKHHKNVNTFHLACVYTHWIEYLLGVVFPLFAGAMILQKYIHVTSVVAATAFRIIETHESHGGIEFEYSLF